ncbi:MAG: radical SAM protein [Pseudomonadales bacterium]|nr:radical SAM protein [Pseudomonadales bacterium]
MTAQQQTHTCILTNPRSQTRDLDSLPIPDRSLIDYEAYHQYIGHAGVKHGIAVQATRGCPYRCFYCDIYKTTKHHFRRSDDHLFEEIKKLADIGISRFEFIDDIFNVNRKQFTRFFEDVIRNNLKLQFFFPTGLKGDLLDHDLIDLMVEGGAVGVNLSLEHAAPRMQKIMRKNLDVDILKDNLEYVSSKYPQVILTLNAMHGFPTETEEEALETLHYIQSIKWIDFPYLHNVRIFPGTELEEFALEVGIPRELIESSQDMSYHENAPTLPFTSEFTKMVRMKFVKDYVLNRDRLLSVIPKQLEQFSEDELNQKYNSYFPNKRITTLNDVLRIAKIDRSEVQPEKPFDESWVKVDNLNEKLKTAFPRPDTSKAKMKLLMIDMSSYFSTDFDNREYNVLEPPLGLLALMSYVNRELEGQVDGKIMKSRLDFDSFEELVEQVKAYKPDLIGFRAMTFYRGFFHDSVAALRDAGIETPVVVGGPYPTASYEDVVKDENIDLVAVGEGENTLIDILKAMMDTDNKLPKRDVLSKIDGLAYRSEPQEVKPKIFDPSISVVNL